MHDLILYIKNLVRQGQIEEALVKLVELSEKIGEKDIEIQSVTISSRYYIDLKQKNLIGDTKIEEQNRIISTILQLIKEIEFRIPSMIKENDSKIDNEIQENVIFLTANDANEIFDLPNKMKISKQIDMAGYSFSNLLKNYKMFLIKAVLNGTQVRIILTKKDSEAFNLMNYSSKKDPMKTDLPQVIETIQEIKNSIAETDADKTHLFEVRFTTWIPSCALIISNRGFDNGELHLKIYPLFYPTYMSDVCPYQVISKSNNKKWFAYFVNQFENLWKFPDCEIENYKRYLDYTPLEI